jgi:8-oxo-dGTP diphosphatase
MATPRVAAGALFIDEHDRVMLVRPDYKPHWDIPGGYVEPGETPLQACAREVREELGITPAIGSLLVVDWAPNPAEGDKVLFVFEGGTLDAEGRTRIRLDLAELAEYAFFDTVALDHVLIPRLARRLLAAIEAREHGNVVYLEHGFVPT